MPAPVAAGYTGRTAIDAGFALTGPALTLAEKLCARAAGAEVVRAGEIVTAAVDLAMIHDSGGPRRVAPMLAELGVGLWDPSKVVLISDHYVPAVDAGSAAILDLTRKWAARPASGPWRLAAS